MPKPALAEPQAMLEQMLIDSMIAGLKEWRPDLYGPESYSDYQGCARGILQMFEVKRAPLPIKLKYKDDADAGRLLSAADARTVSKAKSLN